jgi:Ricin-type beta-trefoil lectin domain
VRPPTSITVRLPAVLTRGVIVAGVLMSLAPAVAFAQNATLFGNFRNRLCLNSTLRGHVYMGNCNGANDWYQLRLTSQVVDRHTGLCLEATHIHLGRVYTTKCRNSPYQSWDSSRVGSRGVFYQNVWTGQCLASGGRANVYVSDCRASTDTNQQWSHLPLD